MGAIALGSLAILLLVGLTKSVFASKENAASKKETLESLLKRAQEGNATIEELRSGAKEARLLGLLNLAEALDLRADLLEEVSKIQETNLSSKVSSPFPSVSDEKWSAYTNKWKSAKANFISPNYHLGMFLSGMRLLEDFGLVTDVHESQYQGRVVWRGNWIEPYSLEGFLSDAKLQYEVFEKQSKRDAKAILTRHKSDIGKVIEGEKATLSGLLAVAKQAGLSGLASWLKGTRKESTTKQYHRFNAIF